MNWELIVVALIAVLGLILSGAFWTKLKNLVMQVAELMDAVSEAIQDDKVDNAEITKILSEAKDVAEATVGILGLFKKK